MSRNPHRRLQGARLAADASTLSRLRRGRFASRLVLLALTIVGCDAGTEIIIREVPAGSYASDDSSSRSFAGFNDEAAEFDLSLSLAESSVLTGAAGRTVDCAGTLPCRWLAEDAGFAVTLTAADDVGTADRLVIEWSVTATHDTELVVGAAGDALVQGGAGPEAARVTLGTGNGLVPTTIRAGDSITGHIDFDAAVGKSSIAE